MKVFKSYKEIAEFMGVEEVVVEDFYFRFLGCDYFVVYGVEFKVVFEEDLSRSFLYIESDKDFKEYFLKYEAPKYRWLCYIDDYEKWQPVKILNITVHEHEIIRATVIAYTTETQVNRWVKYVFDESDPDFIPDRCIYFMDKEGVA